MPYKFWNAENLFMQDLKANEARLQELNSIADKLTAMGRTEAADKIREQIAVRFSYKYNI